MLRSTIKTYDNVDISKFTKLLGFVKSRSTCYVSRKAKVLTDDEIAEFFNEAPDLSYLLIKVIIIFGLSGACRREEIYNLK